MLVVGQRISDAPNDKEQLAADAGGGAGKVSAALAGSGFYSEESVAAVERGGRGPTVQRHGHGRSVRQPEERPDPPTPPEGATVAEVMAHRLETKAGRERYALRKQTVEPVFGIIKEAMGFRRFTMCGREKAGLEWTLVTIAYNLKRLFNLGIKIARAWKEAGCRPRRVEGIQAPPPRPITSATRSNPSSSQQPTTQPHAKSKIGSSPTGC